MPTKCQYEKSYLGLDFLKNFYKMAEANRQSLTQGCTCIGCVGMRSREKVEDQTGDSCRELRAPWKSQVGKQLPCRGEVVRSWPC